MLKFFTIVLAILLLTAPDFCSTNNYAIESIDAEYILLEGLDKSEQEYSHYLKRKSFPALNEGEIVRITKIGDQIIKLEVDQTATHERQVKISNLLEKLEQIN